MFGFRPLPEELISYAREDTHYLLYIYDVLKKTLLERGNVNKNLLHSVLTESTNLCLKVGSLVQAGIKVVLRIEKL